MPENNQNSLIEFHNKITTESSSENKVSFLVCEQERDRYLVPLNQISKSARVNHVAIIGILPDWILGVVNVMGEPVTLLDIKYLLHGIKTEISAEGYKSILVSTAEVGGKVKFALLWDKMNTVVAESELENISQETFNNKNNLIVDFFIDEEGKMYSLLDLNKIKDIKEIALSKEM